MATEKPTTLQLAQQHLREGRPGEAIVLLVSHVKRNPRDLRALTVLEEAYAASGDTAMAEAVAQRATAIEGMIAEATPDTEQKPEVAEKPEPTDRGSTAQRPVKATASRAPLIVAILAGLAVIVTFLGWQSGKRQAAIEAQVSRETYRYTPSPSEDSSPRPQTTTVSPARAKAQWQKVAQWSGNGIKSTPTFTVGSEWAIEWATQPGEYGDTNFQIFIESTDGGLVDLAANIIGRGHDTSYYHEAGTYYLKINSGQPWNVAVWEKQ